MFTRLENGAEVEMEVVTRIESGAEVEADAVYAIKNSAEEEVWANTKLLDLVSNSATNASVTSPSKWGGNTNISSNNAGGTVIYADEGEWYNPTITFDYDGFFAYENSSGSIQTASAGTLYAYGIRSDGTVDKVGSVAINTYTSDTQSYSYTFTGGDYVKVGFQFSFATYGSVTTDQFRMQFVNISNILIDEQKYITDPSDDF